MSKINTIRGGFSGIGGFLGSSFREPEYAGATMAFAQASAPVGWVKQTTYNDCTIRIVSGTASSGGTKAASSVFADNSIYSPVAVPMTIGSHTTTIAEMAAHNHNSLMQPWAGGSYKGGSFVTPSLVSSAGPWTTGGPSVAAAAGHTHTASGSVSFTSPFNFAVKYVNVILATYT